MLKNLSILIITLSILWGCADEILPSPAKNELKGAIRSFVLKTASATTKTTWEYDNKTRTLTGYKTYNIADNALLNSETYVRDTSGKVLSAKVVFADTKLNYDRSYEYNNRGRLTKLTETLASGEQYIEKYTSPFIGSIGGRLITVEIDNMGQGNDFTKAKNALVTMLGTSAPTFDPNGVPILNDGIKYTWHHHQDGRTMLLIPSEVNLKVKHLGGDANGSAGLHEKLPKFGSILNCQ